MPAPRGGSFWTFITILVLLQLLLHLGLGLGATAPDLLTVAVLLGARRLSGKAATLLGALLGLLEDALSLYAFGAEAVTLGLLGFAGARSRDFFLGESTLFLGVYLFVGKWLHDVVITLLTGTGSSMDMVSRLLLHAPIASLYAAVCGTLALGLYRALSADR
jgi:rod shape-determining protein MreD